MQNGHFINSLDPDSKKILGTKYPVFTESEYKRRIALLSDTISNLNLDKVVIYESIGSGSAVQYFTGWHTTQEALVDIVSGEKINLYVEHYNHLPMAEKLINNQTNLIWGERKLSQKIFPGIIQNLDSNSVIGVIGRLPYSYIEQLNEKNIQVIDIFSHYNKMRSIKSVEEVSWMKIAAALTDEGINNLVNNLEPGLSEHEMSQITQSGYLKHGGHKIINFFGITNMDNPDNCVPYQYTSNKTITKDDIWKVFSLIMSALVLPLAGWVWNTNVKVAELQNDLGDAEKEIAELKDRGFESRMVGMEKDMEWMKGTLGRIEQVVTK